jgi:hypothetical protein
VAPALDKFIGGSYSKKRRKSKRKSKRRRR